jgi:hypothetical protein
MFIYINILYIHIYIYFEVYIYIYIFQHYRFVAVMDGPDERIIPGNALAVSHDMPYRGLERFGVAFLNRFEGSQVCV